MGGGASERGPVDRDRWLAEVYSDLRQRAEHLMRGQKNGTLQPTALVHEACLKLFGNEQKECADRAHLFALACTAMRSVLVDYARARQRVKRTAPGHRLPLDGLYLAFEERAVDLLALHDALERLGGFDPEMARAVDLTFFGGLTREETARTLGIPLRTFERRWATTVAWLRAEVE